MEKKYIILSIFVLLVIIIIIMFYKAKDLKRSFKHNVTYNLGKTNFKERDILTNEDLSLLPEPIKKYIIYSGAVGKEKIMNLRIKFSGRIRNSSKDPWMNFISEQYNFFKTPVRQFYMVAKRGGIPAIGLHSYMDGKATMLVKLLGLINVVDAKGTDMDTADTVTVFNDMCVMAPASLIDKRIQWEALDSLTVKGTFTVKGISVSAILYFNEEGQLINFISEDRYREAGTKKSQRVKWSTPLRNYKDFNGRKVATYADAVWHLPEETFTYGEFTLDEVEYNSNIIK